MGGFIRPADLATGRPVAIHPTGLAPSTATPAFTRPAVRPARRPCVQRIDALTGVERGNDLVFRDVITVAHYRAARVLADGARWASLRAAHPATLVGLSVRR